MLHEQTVFFECDPEEDKKWNPRIYRTSLTEDQKPTLFFNGQLIGIFKDVMIACDDEYYYALDLNKKSKWKKLSPAAYTVTSFLMNDTLYLYSFQEFEKFDGTGRFLERIDLNTLERTREDNDHVIIDTLMMDGSLYYLRYAEDHTKVFFCVADSADQKETVLKEVQSGLNLYQAGGKIFCEVRKGTAFLYDPAANTFEMPEENRTYFDGGSFTLDVGENSQWGTQIFQFTLQDGTEYTADLSYRGAGNIVAANSFGAAFWSKTNVCLLDWETKNIRQYYPAELK